MKLDLRWEEIRDSLEDFGSAVLKTLEDNVCKITESHAEKIIRQVTHLDELDSKELEGVFLDLGKTILKQFIK